MFRKEKSPGVSPLHKPPSRRTMNTAHRTRRALGISAARPMSCLNSWLVISWRIQHEPSPASNRPTDGQKWSQTQLLLPYKTHGFCGNNGNVKDSATIRVEVQGILIPGHVFRPEASFTRCFSTSNESMDLGYQESSLHRRQRSEQQQ